MSIWDLLLLSNIMWNLGKVVAGFSWDTDRLLNVGGDYGKKYNSLSISSSTTRAQLILILLHVLPIFFNRYAGTKPPYHQCLLWAVCIPKLNVCNLLVHLMHVNSNSRPMWMFQNNHETLVRDCSMFNISFGLWFPDVVLFLRKNFSFSVKVYMYV